MKPVQTDVVTFLAHEGNTQNIQLIDFSFKILIGRERILLVVVCFCFGVVIVVFLAKLELQIESHLCMCVSEWNVCEWNVCEWKELPLSHRWNRLQPLDLSGMQHSISQFNLLSSAFHSSSSPVIPQAHYMFTVLSLPQLLGMSYGATELPRKYAFQCRQLSPCLWACSTWM